MKKILFAAAAVATLGLAGAANAAVTPDQETLVYNLNGEVQSQCTLSPDGPVNFTMNMTDYGNQGIAGIVFGCNSPYQLKIRSENGGMKHQQSSLRLEYDVKFIGFAANVGLVANTLQSQNITADTVFVSNTAWENIVTNMGAAAGTLELDVPPLAERAVAGNYSDTLTVTLTAVL
jgi:spore coat protein U-like protein